MKPLALAIYLFIFVVVVAVISLATGAQAQITQSCFESRDALLTLVEQQYSERPIGFGTVNDYVMDMTLSDSGSWTVFMTRPDGLACVIASGIEWQFTPESIEPETKTH